MEEQHLLDFEKAKAYLDGLIKYSDEIGDDIENSELLIEFLQNWLRFKNIMSFNFNAAHKFANKHMREVLNLES